MNKWTSISHWGMFPVVDVVVHRHKQRGISLVQDEHRLVDVSKIAGCEYVRWLQRKESIARRFKDSVLDEIAKLGQEYDAG